MSVHDADKDVFIIDDICDGGRTFIEIAKAVNEVRKLSSSVKPEHYGKNYLIVTHGIFSAGFGQLAEYFEGIYTTNSYSMIENDSEDTDIERGAKQKVKQKNVF
jgi:ribose-phosphate pyrophosphokinase